MMEAIPALEVCYDTLGMLSIDQKLIKCRVEDNGISGLGDAGDAARSWPVNFRRKVLWSVLAGNGYGLIAHSVG